MNPRLIVIDPEIQSGEPVFAGTRVPIKNLFDYLEAGDSLDLFLDQFPTVSREMTVAVLEQARSGLILNANPAWRVPPAGAKRSFRWP
jgi:uncharacterized protein (DUF433 family)